MRGLSTGFQNLDTLTGGLQHADVMILAVPPVAGEVSFCLSLALKAATAYHRGVGLFSLEMNRYQVVQRLLAMSAGIDLHRLRTGRIHEDERKRVTTTIKTLARANVWIDDRINPSTAQLRQRARQMVEAHGVTLIIIDNMHLLHVSKTNNEQEYRALERSEIGQGLQALARELRIPIVAVAPMHHSRKCRRSKRMQSSDSHDHSPEKDGEHLLCLYRDEPSQLVTSGSNAVTVKISIAKQQHGLVTEIDLALLPGRSCLHQLGHTQALHITDGSSS